MSVQEQEGHKGVYVLALENALQVHEVPRFTKHPALPARVMGQIAKERLLKISDTYISEAHRIFDTLTVIDEEACAHVGVKNTAVSDFAFRLLQSDEDTVHMPDVEINSFLALSYTWHSPAWRPHPSIATPSQVADGPLTPAMWAALLAQVGDQEAFWIDQLCINQSSESEKIAAIASMDLVYQCARKVVIALEDIALSSVEVNSMFLYAKSDMSRNQISEDDRDRLASAFVKIVAARWFDRAWCLHEFLVGRRHVFLIPVCQQDNSMTFTGSTARILRVDGPFLVQMYHIFLEQDTKHQNAGLDSLLYSGHFTGIALDNIRRFFLRLRAVQFDEVFGTEGSMEDGSYMHMFYEVFSHSATYKADKISIILNTMRSGLYLKDPTIISDEQCVWLVSLIAMAAGDVTVLTTNGPRSIDGGEQSVKNKKWIRVPSSEDQTRPPGVHSIPRTNIDAKIVADGLELDVLFLATHRALTAPSQNYLSIARWLIDHRSLSVMFIDEPEMRIDTEADDNIYAKIRICYIQALACAFACGKEWMLAYYARSHVSLPAGTEVQWDPLPRNKFGQAIDWGLATIIEQDIGSDLNETWQDGGTLMWADDITETQDEDLDADAANQLSIKLSSEEQVWYRLLLEFTERVVNVGLAISPDPDDSTVIQEVWNVQICNLPGVSEFLIYAPITDRQDDFLHLCLPNALWDDVYSWTTRLWLLEEDKNSTLPQRYNLRGKSRLVGITPLLGAPSKRVTIVS
ncbi:hypothetical protein JMJ35_010069 [Cladonia borealis]|uniref:Heterokaryon incompatibility domain-containing protein n=1 Tax=Cladonia borealis TaxID=184061 RepID=A0AA39QTE8_9LECA|nr:hypothetical protein JMJ35_010069 [Cladonia borealis]